MILLCMIIEVQCISINKNKNSHTYKKSKRVFLSLQDKKREMFIAFLFLLFNYYLGFLMLACAAASFAIGTLNGEQDT